MHEVTLITDFAVNHKAMIEVPPVLLLIFNRPDLTERVMEQVRKVEPSKLFIGADGPRAGHPKERQQCEQARDVATHVDWNCDVHTLFRDENLGCKQAVSSAITWFFEHVEAGIILEDDCVPHPTFFPYCAELLERYREDERIRVISGNNFQPADRAYNSSYYFSIYNHCWGWATWRNAWKSYNGAIPEWPNLKNTSWLQGWLGSEAEASYWSQIFDRVCRGQVDSWAYPWTFACWKEHGLTVLPAMNLVANIGFGEAATHTKTGDAGTPHRPTEAIGYPLKHPSVTTRDYRADRYTSQNHFGIQTTSTPWYQNARNHMPELIRQTLRPIMDQFRN